MDNVFSIAAHIIESKEQAPEYEKEPGGKERVRRLSESRPLYQRSRFPWRESRPREEQAHNLDNQHNEADSSNGPGEANGRKQPFNHCRINQTTSRSPTSDGSHSQGTMPTKIRSEQSGQRTKDEPNTNTLAQTLSQKKLPIPRAKRRHENPQQEQETARHVRELEISRVRGSSAKGAGEEQQP